LGTIDHPTEIVIGPQDKGVSGLIFFASLPFLALI
jgi:hypothetical protein